MELSLGLREPLNRVTILWQTPSEADSHCPNQMHGTLQLGEG